MDIVNESTSKGRRKRRSVDTTTFVVEIGDKPQDPISVDFETVGKKIINKVTWFLNSVILMNVSFISKQKFIATCLDL